MVFISLRSMFANVGNAVGSALGGLMLLFSYQALGFALGAISIISALIVQSLVKDPYK